MLEQMLTDISNWQKLNSILSAGTQQVILGEENNYDILSIMCPSLETATLLESVTSEEHSMMHIELS